MKIFPATLLLPNKTLSTKSSAKTWGFLKAASYCARESAEAHHGLRLPKQSARQLDHAVKLIIIMLFVVVTGSAQTELPDTPAGHTLKTWLEAFNSGDRSKIEDYVRTVDTSENVDGLLTFHSRTGDFEVLSIESSEPLHLRFRIKDHTGTITLASLFVKDGRPPTVETFATNPIPPGATPVDLTLDAKERKKVLEGIKQTLLDYYVEPATAQKMVEALEAHAIKGDYDQIHDGDVLAARLTKDLQQVSHDRHIRVDFSPFKAPVQTQPDTDAEQRYHLDMERTNCGFTKIEVLPNNVGYLKLDEFADESFCGATVVAAMGFLANTESLIIDLRQNEGGQPDMVAFIASYLFDHSVHLYDMYNRRDKSTVQTWTLSYVPGPRLTKQPVFILTSKDTFSGAEAFAFHLKSQKRAMIIGEVTGGGAHPVSGHTIAEYFTIGVPFAKSLDAISKRNWEGTGVEPDVKSSEADALAVAEKIALEKMPKQKSEN